MRSFDLVKVDQKILSADYLQRRYWSGQIQSSKKFMHLRADNFDWKGYTDLSQKSVSQSLSNLSPQELEHLLMTIPVKSCGRDSDGTKSL